MVKTIIRVDGMEKDTVNLLNTLTKAKFLVIGNQKLRNSTLETLGNDPLQRFRS